jgi:hypothetical protein
MMIPESQRVVVGVGVVRARVRTYLDKRRPAPPISSQNLHYV